MTKMVNISDEQVRIAITHGPGTDPQVFYVEAGESEDFQAGYCKPVPGAGQDHLQSIIERKSWRNRTPRLVREEDEEMGRARWVNRQRQLYEAECERTTKAGLPRPEVPSELASEVVTVDVDVGNQLAAALGGEALADPLTPKPERKKPGPKKKAPKG